MEPAPAPAARTAPVSWLMSCQDPMEPWVPDGSRMITRDTRVAEPHLIEMEPVDPTGDQ